MQSALEVTHSPSPSHFLLFHHRMSCANMHRKKPDIKIQPHERRRCHKRFNNLMWSNGTRLISMGKTFSLWHCSVRIPYIWINLKPFEMHFFYASISMLILNEPTYFDILIFIYIHNLFNHVQKARCAKAFVIDSTICIAFQITPYFEVVVSRRTCDCVPSCYVWIDKFVFTCLVFYADCAH